MDSGFRQIRAHAVLSAGLSRPNLAFVGPQNRLSVIVYYAPYQQDDGSDPMQPVLSKNHNRTFRAWTNIMCENDSLCQACLPDVKEGQHIYSMFLIICTLSCTCVALMPGKWSEMCMLLLQVLDRLREVAAEKGVRLAYLLDTKGPEVRTAMLRGGKDITLEKGQEVILVAVGPEYETWEGFKDPTTGTHKIC